MSEFEMGREFQKLSDRVAAVERNLSRRNRGNSLTMDTSLTPPSLSPAPDDVAKADVLIDPYWIAPFQWPISAPLNSGGPRVNDISISPAIEPSGHLGLVLSGSTFGVDDDDTGYKYHGCWFEFTYVTPFRGRVYATAEFSVGPSTLKHDVLDEFGVSAVYAYAMHLHFIRAWRKINGVFTACGYGGDAYNTWLWQVSDNRPHPHYQDNSNKPATIVMYTDLDLNAEERVWLQVGIRTGASFSTNDYSISTFSNFESRLLKLTSGTVRNLAEPMQVN